jgi:cobalt/nickel transport protein
LRKTLNARLGLASVLLLAGTSLASAHFLVMQGSDAVRTPNQALDLLVLFSHPFTAGPDMTMGTPEAFELIHQRGDAEPTRTDLMETLTEIEWHGADGTVAAYRADIPASMLRSAGDYTFAFTPAPFLEATEDVYIQQITKLVVNIEGVPGNWDQPVGLPAEIVPLNRPYGNWVGGVFRGVVLSDGQPVPNAEIEVEFINYEPDHEAARWGETPTFETDNPSLENISIRADAQGTFSIGLPHEGWWGIGALGVGPDTEHEGKELSQDAVLWVYAEDIG